MIWVILAVVIVVVAVAGISVAVARPDPLIDPVLEARAEVAIHRVRTNLDEHRRRRAITRRAEATREQMRIEMTAYHERHRP